MKTDVKIKPLRDWSSAPPHTLPVEWGGGYDYK